ncbi:MAG: sulfatase-like hydrolase/transferase [Verrucomicrobia bacterium]|nr:sulfatase-like hydrolase/transferase [Verrucomicrobiota bacterium]
MKASRLCLLAFALILFAAGGLSASDAAPPPKPNFLVVMADDATFNELPLYGGKNLRTPSLDRLAEQGVVFRHAYVCMSMCWPCRAELYTGLYPMRTGVCWNHTPARPGTRSITHHLGALGYRVGLAGKVHAQPRSVYGFD